MRVFAIDPGPERSAYVIWDGRIMDKGILPTAELLDMVRSTDSSGTTLIIEWIESFGMVVGKEVFVTCRWIGMMAEAWRGIVEYMTRREVKLNLCRSMKAKDANIRQALIDRYGEPGVKKAPGMLYGVRADEWSALAVAVTYFDQHEDAPRQFRQVVERVRKGDRV